MSIKWWQGQQITTTVMYFQTLIKTSAEHVEQNRHVLRKWKRNWHGILNELKAPAKTPRACSALLVGPQVIVIDKSARYPLLCAVAGWKLIDSLTKAHNLSKRLE
jgi:hypothetical protein